MPDVRKANCVILIKKLKYICLHNNYYVYLQSKTETNINHGSNYQIKKNRTKRKSINVE